jgi:hypothetical protein
MKSNKVKGERLAAAVLSMARLMAVWRLEPDVIIGIR